MTKCSKDMADMSYRAPSGSRIRNNNFIVGQLQASLDSFIVDELKFWSDFKTEEEMKEIGEHAHRVVVTPFVFSHQIS